MFWLKVCVLLEYLYITRINADISTYYLDDELCNQFINMTSYNNQDLHSFRLKLSVQHYYPHNLDCLLQIQVQKDSEHIMFYFKWFDIRPETLPEYCNYDWLELHDGNSTESEYVCGIDSKICGISPSRTKSVYLTRGHFLTLYFKSSDEEKYTGFDMVITRYRYGECRSDEYTCDNGRCIDQSLQCNGFNPCGDGSDCKRLHPGWKAAIAASTLGLVMLVIIIVQAVKLAKKNRQIKDVEKQNGISNMQFTQDIGEKNQGIDQGLTKDAYSINCSQTKQVETTEKNSLLQDGRHPVELSYKSFENLTFGSLNSNEEKEETPQRCRAVTADSGVCSDSRKPRGTSPNTIPKTCYDGNSHRKQFCDGDLSCDRHVKSPDDRQRKQVCRCNSTPASQLDCGYYTRDKQDDNTSKANVKLNRYNNYSEPTLRILENDNTLRKQFCDGYQPYAHHISCPDNTQPKQVCRCNDTSSNPNESGYFTQAKQDTNESNTTVKLIQGNDSADITDSLEGSTRFSLDPHNV